MKPQEPEVKKIQLQIDPETEKGTYTNTVTIMHSENEFLIDFGMFLPGKPVIRINSRIIATPRTAKQLLIALQDNIKKFEEKFGIIDPGIKPIPDLGPAGNIIN